MYGSRGYHHKPKIAHQLCVCGECLVKLTRAALLFQCLVRFLQLPALDLCAIARFRTTLTAFI